MPVWLASASLLVLASGLLLLWRDSDGFQVSLLARGPNLVYATGGLIAILATVIGLAVNSPTARRIGRLAAQIQAGGMPPAAEQAAELARMQATLSRSGRVTAGLLLLTTIAMAVARYVT